MPGAPRTSRRHVVLIITFAAILAIVFITSFRSQPVRTDYQYAASRAKSEAELEGVPTPEHTLASAPATAPAPQLVEELSQATLSGHAIAPKLGNETLKAELGRAAWKLLHTVMARFPDTPTADEKSALKSYVHLLQRLYPCGECAEHFGEILDKFPPQVSSRSAAAAWACHVHNEVNKSLNKDIFDCANIGDFYDCGCADDEKEGMNAAGADKKSTISQVETEKVTGSLKRDPDPNRLSIKPFIKVEKKVHRHRYDEK